MYFVDREKIEATLRYMESTFELFEESSSWETTIEKFALERMAHTVIEGILDVGNAMIDGFIMRDPGSYEDIIDILEDEKVITTDDAHGIKSFIMLRKSLVQNYINVDHTSLFSQFQESLPTLKNFPLSVRTYLENELGPVSAFKS